MTVRTTRWSPDTCGCILEYEWDDAAPQDQRVHSYKNTVKSCPEHGALAGAPLYTTVVAENTVKNRVVPTALSLLTAFNEEKLNEIFQWWFDAQRVLNVTFVGLSLTNQQKNQLQDFFNQALGAGKVKLV